MGFRRSFTGWVGAVTVLFGIAFIAIAPSLPGLARVSPMINHGISVPLWGGVLLIMSGMAVVVEVLGRKKKNLTYSLFKFPMVSLMANLISFIVTCIILAVFTWAMYDDFLKDPDSIPGDNLRGQALSIFGTVAFMAAILLMLTLFAMFMDCCASFLVVPNARNDVPVHGPPAVYESRVPAIAYR